MDVANGIVYGSCWVVLVVYSISILLILTQRSYTVYATSFLFACILWVELTLFNLWFILPAFLRDLSELELPAVKEDKPFVSIIGGVMLSFITSAAMGDLVLMLVGWAASAVSLSNSFELWQLTERDLDAEELDFPSLAERRVVCLARCANDYVGFYETGELKLPGPQGDTWRSERTSVLFAVPRWFHRRIMKGKTSGGMPSARSDDAFERLREKA